MAIPAIVLSPRPGHDYKKTRAGRTEARDDFVNDVPFVLGISSGRPTDQVVTKTHIFKTIRGRAVTEAIVVILNHSKSEILRLTLECTYKVREK